MARESEQQVDELETEIRNLKEQKYQLYVDDAESNISNANAQKELVKGYVDQNKYLDEQKTYLKQSYDYQIKIAELTNDTTKVAQLQAEYQKELWDLEKEKFDNIETYYENQIGLLELSEKKIQEQIDLLETKGMTVNAKYYKSEIAYQEGIRGEYELSKKALQDQLTVMENAGLKGSDTWYESVVALNDVDSAIAECNTTIAEMNNNITEVANTIQTRLINSISNVSEEMDWIANLMSDKDLINDNAGFTKEGLATMGTYVSGMNTSSYASEITKGLLDEMQKALDNNELSFTYNSQEWIYNSKEQLIDSITEVNSTYRDQITDIFDYSTKLVDLMIQKYEAELSSLKEVIDRKKESINLEKETNDYKNTISEKVENVSSLQKQIVAVRGDSSLEGQARLQKLEKQLQTAQKDLEQTEYEKAIQDSEAMLDKLYAEYEELINKKTSDRDALLQQAKDAVVLSASNIQDTITDLAEKYDYSDVLSNIETGLTTMTGTDSALEAIKTSVLNSIEPAGTIPTAIDGLKLSVENGLSTITTLLQQILTASGTTIPTSVESDTSNTTNSSSVTIGGQTYGTGYNKVESKILNPIDYKTNEAQGLIDTSSKKTMKDGAVSFIKQYADKTTKKKSEVSDVNQKIYKLTSGKVLTNDELEELASLLGVEYNGNKKSGNLYKKLKSIEVPGFSKGGVVAVDDIEKQVKANGDTVLVSAREDEGFLTKPQMASIQDLVKVTPMLNDMLQPLVSLPKLPEMQPLRNTNQVVQIDNITLPNVTNYDEFKTQMFKDMQKDVKFEKMVQSMATPSLGGRNRLEKYKYKF